MLMGMGGPDGAERDVEPIHLPVTLATTKEYGVWMQAHGTRQLRYRTSALKIVIGEAKGSIATA